MKIPDDPLGEKVEKRKGKGMEETEQSRYCGQKHDTTDEESTHEQQEKDTKEKPVYTIEPTQYTNQIYIIQYNKQTR